MDRSNGYESIAAAFLAGRGNPAKAQVGAAAVRAWARRLPPRATVLDLGCGCGIPITQILIEEGLEVYAVDASPSLAAAFRERFPGVPIACEAAEESPFFHRSFDAIVAWGVLFLLPADEQVVLLPRMAAALTPGGRLLYTSPSQVCEWSDAMTGRQSRSLGAEAYRGVLLAAGLIDLREYDDEGENHYYDAGKPGAELGEPASVSHPARALQVVKTVHTIVWTLFAGAIFAVPVYAWQRRYDIALLLAGLVLIEVLVLAVNRWRCQLTAVAARYTDDRRPNFDIYLPEWLARHNKGIFGALFVAGLLFTWARWRGWLG